MYYPGEVNFLRQYPYLSFYEILFGDLVKIIVTVLQTMRRKVTSGLSGTQTSKDSSINSY